MLDIDISQVPVSPELLDHVESIFAPPDDPVFELVPPLFDQHASKLYLGIGQPVVTSTTLWIIFRDLLRQFRATAENDDELMSTIAAHSNEQAGLYDQKMALLPNMKPFRNGEDIMGPKGSHYAGGLAHPPGATSVRTAAQPEYTEFTDSEDELADAEG
jgi:hypothetical protein